MKKKLALGTALWGWGVTKENAHKLLSNFYEKGFRFVDTAYNYPLNGLSSSLHESLKILSEWIKTHGINDLKIIYKAGSVTNQNTPDNDLSIHHLKQNIELSLEKFGNNNIESFMVHWDNQKQSYSKNHFKDIFLILKKYNIHFGLSGIKYPKVYQDCLSETDLIYLQGKNNLFFSDISKYNDLILKNKRFFSYGISVSGLKLNKNEYSKTSYVSLTRNKSFHDNIMTLKNKKTLNNFLKKHSFVKSMYHTGIVLNEENKDVYGYIVGPRNIDQLNELFLFKKEFNASFVSKTIT